MSFNSIKINTNEVAEFPEISYIDNPEFAFVKTDNEDRILYGIKQDGEFFFGAGCPHQVRVYVEQKLAELSLDEYEDIVAFLSNLEKSDETLQNLLDKKVDGEYVENSEYVEVKTDSEGKLLAGRTSDGAEFENVSFATSKVSIDGHTIENIEDLEGRSEITTDSEGKIISYRDKSGVKHEDAGIETNNLELTEQGMTEFQKALKDAGFHHGGSGDWSDKTSMYIPEPRLAHLNIITDFELTALTKTSDVKCQVEFTDGAGNYFKKWIILNGQGRSSLQFLKKGLGADFFNEDPNSEDFDEDNVFSMKFGDWVYQDSFHIKSYYTDFPRCTTPVVYRLAEEVAHTKGIMADRPYKKYYVGDYRDVNFGNNQLSDIERNIETGARCVPDGFPVIVYQNGEFWGVNSWQLKKHRDNYLLSKKKDINVHLDGDMSTRPIGGVSHDPFWLWDGVIQWDVYCSGVAGIETRNPKNLYCVDGKKYDVDTHDVEIIDTATAEEWIAAGQIIPTGKTIDSTLAGYLRTTGKVRKHIEDLTTYIPYINRLIDGTELIDGQQATPTQIRDAIAERFDIDVFVDFIVLHNVVGDTDCWDNNGQIITWGKLDGSDLLNWSVCTYDCDITFGCIWSGQYAEGANGNKLGSGFPLYKIFWDYYYDELKARYHELRDAGIFDTDHITQLFRDWMNRVGIENYKKEYEKWPESPCFRDGTQTYHNYPETQGFYGSIYRIYLWIKKRIQYMDAADFFDYNN